MTHTIRLVNKNSSKLILKWVKLFGKFELFGRRQYAGLSGEEIFGGLTKRLTTRKYHRATEAPALTSTQTELLLFMYYNKCLNFSHKFYLLIYMCINFKIKLPEDSKLCLNQKLLTRLLRAKFGHHEGFRKMQMSLLAPQVFRLVLKI